MQLTQSSLKSSINRPLSVSRRRDLRVVKTRHRHSSAIVIKDPIAMRFHRLRPEEYFVLERLSTNETLQSLCDAFDRQFAPQRVTPAEMNSLVLRLHQCALTVSDSAGQGDSLSARRRRESLQKLKQHASSLLFIRFPGVDPEPLLRRLYPAVRPLLGRFGIAMAVSLVLAALILFASRWNDFSAEFPRITQWLRPDSMLILAMVIGLTKVCHELGHAIACKHFGGECHSIGPMLLVFTPALYCDTSDSWMLPNRLHRAVIGMAGMMTEILIASVATIMWANTASGLPHVFAMNVMVVCGISTVLFNANPLLRYDGYYVLSDLCDVPNLGETSKRLLSARMARLMFGVEGPVDDEFDAPARGMLMAYALAADAYRISLTVMILWMLSVMLRPYQLDSIGYLLCVVTGVGMITTMVRTPIRFLRNPAKRRRMKLRQSLLTIIAVCFLGAFVCYPFASTVTTPGRVVPRSEFPIYVTSAGKLIDMLAEPGDLVQKGQPIARLENATLVLEAEKLRGKVATQQGVVESLRHSQVTVPEAGNQLRVAESVLNDLEEQLRSRQLRVDGLTIAAPSSGRLIEAPRKPRAAHEEMTLASWSGTPSEKFNRRCYLETGTEIYSVMTPDQWDVEVPLDATDVQRIAIGNRVRLILESLPSKLMEGVISDIARGEWNADQNFERRDHPKAGQSTQPLVPTYVLRVQLRPTDIPLVTGASCKVRIAAENASLLERTWTILTRLIRFR